MEPNEPAKLLRLCASDDVIDLEAAREKLAFERYSAAIVTRDPYTRFASAWCDKFVSRPVHGTSLIAKWAGNHFGVERADVTLRMLLEWMRDSTYVTRRGNVDSHLALQSEGLEDIINRFCVIRLESGLENKLITWFDLRGLGSRVREYFQHRPGKQNPTEYAEVMYDPLDTPLSVWMREGPTSNEAISNNPTVRSMLHKLYRIDFCRLGYST